MKRTGMMSIRDILRHRHGFALTRAQVAAAAIACGSRGVSLDIWPASVFGTRRIVRCPLPGHDRDRS